MNKRRKIYTKLNYKEIGHRIKFLRGELSQEAFSSKIEGLTQTDVSRIENGMFDSKMNILFEICKQYNKDLMWLLIGDEPAGSNGQVALHDDPEIAEIIEFLTTNPADKKMVLKLLKGKRDIEEALDGLNILGIKIVKS